MVTGGIVSCQDSSWLLSWTINRQGQFKEQDPEKVCIWVYGLFTDRPGDYVHKPMKDCTGREITEEWLYHLGVPVEEIPQLADESAVCVPTMMPYITAFFMPRAKGDRPDVIPDGCVNFAFLGQFADTPRDTVFTTEYSVRTAMEAVYGLLGWTGASPKCGGASMTSGPCWTARSACWMAVRPWICPPSRRPKSPWFTSYGAPSWKSCCGNTASCRANES